MVLFYGLLALETANNAVGSQRKARSNQRMSSSSNSWIYTQDLRRHFEERHADYRYIFVPIYINEKKETKTETIPENSWMYTRSLRKHLYRSASKIEESLPRNTSSTKHLIEENGQIEKYPVPLIKNESIIPANKSSTDSHMKSNTKHLISHNQRLTRLRSFFSRSSSASLPTTQQ